MPEIPVPEPLPNPNGENRLDTFLHAPYHGALDVVTSMTNEQAQQHILSTSMEASRYETRRHSLELSHRDLQRIQSLPSEQHSQIEMQRLSQEIRVLEIRLTEDRIHPVTDELSAYIVLSDQIEAAKKADEANRTEQNR